MATPAPLKIVGLPSLFFATIAISLFSTSYLQAYGHVGSAGEETEEQLVLSRYVKGNIVISADPEDEQWKQSTEDIVESAWQHKVQVMSLNNGTHIFFLLLWDDPTRATEGPSGVADGAAILFETKQKSEDDNGQGEAPAEQSGSQQSENDEGFTVQEEGEEKQELWNWSTDPQTSKILNSETITTKAEWDHDHWSVLMGRKTAAGNDSIAFSQGVREEGFVKFVVWDGDKKESFEQIDEEKLPHLDFVMLPEIDVYPKDVYVWSGVLVGGTVSFLVIEQRLYKGRKHAKEVGS